jgi:glycosyltransferase involved in cell wall biosynthesis
MLAEACASVRAQTLQPDGHVIAVDYRREGIGATRNRAMRACPNAEWFAFLDDDDILLPRHLEKLAAHREKADVIYPNCEVRGVKVPWTVGPFSWDRLRRGNYIPVTTLVRAALVRSLGGFHREDEPQADFGLWKRAHKVEADFHFVPEVTWIYRLRETGETFSPTR